MSANDSATGGDGGAGELREGSGGVDLGGATPFADGNGETGSSYRGDDSNANRTPAVAASSPVGIGKAHTCDSKYYPEAAQRMREEGTTTVTFTVTAEGDVTNPTIVKSSGHGDLDRAALPCVMTWKYKPAIQEGKPITAQWTANVVWKAV